MPRACTARDQHKEKAIALQWHAQRDARMLGPSAARHMSTTVGPFFSLPIHLTCTCWPLQSIAYNKAHQNRKLEISPGNRSSCYTHVLLPPARLAHIRRSDSPASRSRPLPLGTRTLATRKRASACCYTNGCAGSATRRCIRWSEALMGYNPIAPQVWPNDPLPPSAYCPPCRRRNERSWRLGVCSAQSRKAMQGWR